VAAAEYEPPLDFGEAPPDRMLQFFTYTHLPPGLREVSQRFCELAHWVAAELPAGPERTVCLRKLLEAKDAAVRTRLAASGKG
jgi:hypothetical protein